MQRQAERQLDADEDLRLRQSHPPGRFDHVRIDALDREERVREDRRNRDHDEREQAVPEEAEVEDEDGEADEDDARQGTPEVRQRERDEEATVLMAEPEPEGQRQGDRDSEGRKRQLDRSDSFVEEERRVLRDELERVDEDVRDHRARSHGVSARWSSPEQPVGDEGESNDERARCNELSLEDVRRFEGVEDRLARDRRRRGRLQWWRSRSSRPSQCEAPR